MILSKDKVKIKHHILKLIKAKTMRGAFCLHLMVYGEKQQEAFMHVVESMSKDDGYSFVIINGVHDRAMMNVLVSWKYVHEAGYKPSVQYVNPNT